MIFSRQDVEEPAEANVSRSVSLSLQKLGLLRGKFKAAEDELRDAVAESAKASAQQVKVIIMT
jgi:hypothetical protein